MLPFPRGEGEAKGGGPGCSQASLAGQPPPGGLTNPPTGQPWGATWLLLGWGGGGPSSMCVGLTSLYSISCHQPCHPHNNLLTANLRLLPAAEESPLHVWRRSMWLPAIGWRGSRAESTLCSSLCLLPLPALTLPRFYFILFYFKFLSSYVSSSVREKGERGCFVVRNLTKNDPAEGGERVDSRLRRPVRFATLTGRAR